MGNFKEDKTIEALKDPLYDYLIADDSSGLKMFL